LCCTALRGPGEGPEQSTTVKTGWAPGQLPENAQAILESFSLSAYFALLFARSIARVSVRCNSGEKKE
jgi:hypothetical protein